MFQFYRNDEQESLLELLWDHGPVAQPLGGQRFSQAAESSDVGPTAGADKQQLFMEEDELASWLHHCDQAAGGGGGGELGELMMEPLSRASCCDQVAVATASTVTATAEVTRPGSSSVVAADADEVFDAGSVRASACASGGERKRKAGKEPELCGEVGR